MCKFILHSFYSLSFCIYKYSLIEYIPLEVGHCLASYKMIMPAKFQVFGFLHFRKIRFSINPALKSPKLGVVSIYGCGHLGISGIQVNFEKKKLQAMLYLVLSQTFQ